MKERDTQSSLLLMERLDAARNIDWQQVGLNGGPPCFHIEDGRFCLRAERWEGHQDAASHPFVPLHMLLRYIAERF